MLNARNCILFLTVFVCVYTLCISLYSFRACEPLYLLGLLALSITKSIIPDTKSIIPDTKSIIPDTKSIIPDTKSIKIMVKYQGGK